MRMDRFTSKLQSALADAQSMAVGRDHNQVHPLHLLAVIVQDPGPRQLLARAGSRIDQLEQGIGSAIDRLATVAQPTGEVSLSPEFIKLLNLTDRLAQKRGDAFISSELLLLAAVDDTSEAGTLLRDSGVTTASLEQAINDLRQGETVSDPNAEDTRQALEKYTVDLTARAEEGKLDRSSAATTRFVGRFRCCSDGPKTTRCSLANRG